MAALIAALCRLRGIMPQAPTGIKVKWHAAT